MRIHSLARNFSIWIYFGIIGLMLVGVYAGDFLRNGHVSGEFGAGVLIVLFSMLFLMLGRQTVTLDFERNRVVCAKFLGFHRQEFRISEFRSMEVVQESSYYLNRRSLLYTELKLHSDSESLIVARRVWNTPFIQQLMNELAKRTSIRGIHSAHADTASTSR